MKVLVADKLSDKAIHQLQTGGAEVIFNPDLKAEDLPSEIGDAEILVVRSTKVTADTINTASSLSLIIRAGAGVNTIDLETASNCGINVANCPGKNTDAVAELAIGLMIAADRRIPAAGKNLTDGKWRKKEYGKAGGLKGRTIAVIGTGMIGCAVAERAKGLKMNVIAWSRSLTPERAEVLELGYCATPLEAAKKADVISVHLASTPETRHFINADFLNTMKDGAILINTSRGEVVDTTALKEAMASKGIKAGLDVFEDEPAGGDAKFTDTELAVTAACTPHIGASTDQAAEAIADEVIHIVNAYRDTGKPLNVVNIRKTTSAVRTLVVRHYNRVGVLAGVLDALRTEDINIEEMENTILQGGQAASCSLKLDDTPSDSLVDNIRAAENIIQVSLK